VNDTRLFMIGVAAELAGMHPQTLRMYERRGLVTPTRSAGGTRLYSYEDVTRLRQIQELSEQGFNLVGIDRILHLERELERALTRLRELEAEMAKTAQGMHDEMTRSLSTALVRARPTAHPAPIIHPVIQRRNRHGS